jgi:hypothetical protein
MWEAGTYLSPVSCAWEEKERRREALAMASVSGGDPLAASSERGVLRARRPPSSSVGDDRRSKATATTGDGSAWGRK